MKPKEQNLKEEVIRFCRERNVDLVGVAPVERWDEAGEVPPEFRPRALWPFSRTVIVAGLPMLLPIVETTPSVLHKEMYTVVNHKLDTLAYELANFLNGKGWASSFFGRDTYANLKALRDAPFAAFSHVMAAKYAGLGTIGVSHCLLTRAYGPRVRFVSILTAANLPGDPTLTEELCIKCGACDRCCPKQALAMRPDQVIGDYDKAACLEMHEELVRRRCYPCGICTKVCPVGEDRRLFKEKNIQRKYLREAKALAANPGDPDYASWTHIRRWGSLPESTPGTEGNKEETIASGKGPQGAEAMDLNEFVKSMTALLTEEPPEAEIIRQGRALLSRLTASGEWFQENMARLILDPTWRAGQRHTIWPNEITLAWGADPEFSVLAYIWEPGMMDVVHDHGSWGVLACLFGIIDEIKYQRLDDGSREGFAELRPHSPFVMNPGETTFILPLDQGIHRLANAARGHSVSVHVYGRPVRRGYIRNFYPEEKRVTVAYPPPAYKAALAIRLLAEIERPWSVDLLNTTLRENVPDVLKKECEQALSKRMAKTGPPHESLKSQETK